MKSQSASLVPQFDRILGWIEAGLIERGIAYLTGLLDAAMFACIDPNEARAILNAHPLSLALRHPRLVAESRQLDLSASHTARAQLAERTLKLARQRGERCLVIEQAELPAIVSSYDLIVASSLPDQLTAIELDAAIAALAGQLGPGGRLAFSAFVPGHLGWGWQSIWLNREVQHHEPEEIIAAARGAGLEPRLFHDAGECLVWVELSRGQSENGGTYA